MKHGWVLTLAICCSILPVGCGRVPAAITKTAVEITATQPVTPVITPSASITPSPQTDNLCAYTWVTQSLPEVSAKLQAAFDKAGLSDYQVKASVYGENCMAADGSVVSFSALETDIYITVSVPNLQNRSDLGDRIYSLAHVLYGIDYGQFGPTGLPGAKVGYWGVTFQQGDQTVRLWAPEPTIGICIANGLRGAALLDALQNH